MLLHDRRCCCNLNEGAHWSDYSASVTSEFLETQNGYQWSSLKEQQMIPTVYTPTGRFHAYLKPNTCLEVETI